MNAKEGRAMNKKPEPATEEAAGPPPMKMIPGTSIPDLRVPAPPKPVDGPADFSKPGSPLPEEIQARVGVPRPRLGGFARPTKPKE
jgi:hypothetical protein